jgi:DtxR family Mn-dependent transcriptional regulator
MNKTAGETIMTGAVELSSSLEDYLEAIAELADSGGKAHCNDIAQRLNVKKPSVTTALQTLMEKGLIDYRPYMTP